MSGKYGAFIESGIKCEMCDCTNAFRCAVDFEDEEDGQMLCGEHAAKEGYCCCCGTFCSGMTSFDFHHPGYCDNCYSEVGEEDEL